MSLYHAIFEYDAEHILYETGLLLKAGGTDELENTWIDILCKIAEHVASMEATLFLEVLILLDSVLLQPQIVVRDAFILSVKLSYLLKRVSCHARDKSSIHKLRDKIKTLFPETAALSQEGVATFSKILPPVDKVDEYQFAHRIIAGLSKIWTECRYEDARNCMEYLSRRRIEIADEMDMTTFLWGVIHIFFKNEENVATTYRVFSWNETKKTRKERIGLLWSLFYWVRPPKANIANTLVWRDDEVRVFQRIHEKHKDLWQQIMEEDAQEVSEKEVTGVDMMLSFEPRGESYDTACHIEPYEDKRKNIELKKSKTEHLASKGIKEKSSEVSKSHRHETYHLDPRHWRVYTCKEGAGT